VRTRGALANNPERCTELNQIIAAARSERHTRERTVAEAARACVKIDPSGVAELDLVHWKTLPPVIASQLLADVLRTVDGGPHRPRAGDTARLIDALHAPTFTRRTLQRCEIMRDKNTLRIAREMARVAPPITLMDQGECRWDNRFHVQYNTPCPLVLRALGRDGLRQLSHYSYVSPATPSLWHLDECIGLPHIDCNTTPAASVKVRFAPAKPLDAPPFW
jgi:hypothetical protein